MWSNFSDASYSCPNLQVGQWHLDSCGEPAVLKFRISSPPLSPVQLFQWLTFICTRVGGWEGWLQFFRSPINDLHTNGLTIKIKCIWPIVSVQ